MDISIGFAKFYHYANIAPAKHPYKGSQRVPAPVSALLKSSLYYPTGPMPKIAYMALHCVLSGVNPGGAGDLGANRPQ